MSIPEGLIEGAIWSGGRRHLASPDVYPGTQGHRAVCNRYIFTYDLERTNKFRKTPLVMDDILKCRACSRIFKEWS